MKKIGLNIFKNSQIKLIFILFAILIALIIYMVSRDNSILISQSDANTLANNNKIEKIVADGDYLYLIGDKNNFKVYKYGINNSKYFSKYKVETKESNLIYVLLGILFFIVALGFLLKYLKPTFYNGDSFKKILKTSNNESPMSQKINSIKSNIKFKDIAGIEDVKEELNEIIDFLKSPKKYKDLDIRLPRGLLLVGSPGVGKTMIAKAVAGEASVPFYYQSGASFVQIYVGMGAKRVSELFMEAKKNAPSIIFIDEIDAVGKSRTGQQNDEREATLNQLLTEMDGFEDSEGVMVIAATNKIEVLDEALLRAGRFDRRIFVSLPDFNERIKTLELYLSKKRYSLDINAIAKMSVGFNFASISAWVNEAAFSAFKKGNDLITIEDFESVKDKVAVGKKRVSILNDEEREIRATYQAAKAIMATINGISFDRIGIASELFHPYGNQTISKRYIEKLLMVKIAGTIATEITYGDMFDIGSDDIREARDIAIKISDNFDILPSNASNEILDGVSRNVKKVIEKLTEKHIEISRFIMQHENITQEKTTEILNEVL